MLESYSIQTTALFSMGGNLQVSLEPLNVPRTSCSWPRKGRKAILPGPLAENEMVTFSSGVCWAISLDFSPLKFARKTDALPPTPAIWVERNGEASI